MSSDFFGVVGKKAKPAGDIFKLAVDINANEIHNAFNKLQEYFKNLPNQYPDVAVKVYTKQETQQPDKVVVELASLSPELKESGIKNRLNEYVTYFPLPDKFRNFKYLSK